MERLRLTDKGDGVLHALEGRRHKGGKSDHCDILLYRRVDYELRVNVPSEVDDGVAVVVEQGLDDVLADVVNVALDCGENDLALAHARAARFGEVLLYHLKARLSGVRALDKLRQEYLFVLKVRAYPVEGGDQLLVNDRHSVLCFEQLFCRRGAFVFQSAVNGGGKVGFAVLRLCGRLRRRCVVVGGDKVVGVLVVARENPERAHSARHDLDVRVEDRQVKPLLERHREEG